MKMKPLLFFWLGLSSTIALAVNQIPKQSSNQQPRQQTSQNVEEKFQEKFSSEKILLNQTRKLDAKAQETKIRVLREIRNGFEKKDDLQLRVLIKLFATYPVTVPEWNFIRRVLHSRPTVGFDIIFKWDQLRPGTIDLKSRENKINNLMAQADAAMLEEDFDKSFRYYQLLGKILKQEIVKGQKDNYYLYWSSIHSMARALYGAGRYKESLQVYGWISRDYYKFRQSLFEKMWAAFRANRFDIAMGAIASQQSSFYSDFLEPETYLIQVYIFKKLCRVQELDSIRQLIKGIRSKVDPTKGNYSLADWVKSDVEILSLYRMLSIVIDPQDAFVNRKKLEQTRIRQMLEKRFQAERERISKQLDMVLGLSNLSVSMDQSKINIEVVPDRATLLKSNKEFWPTESAEDWIDEQGGHLYIGSSQCAGKPK